MQTRIITRPDFDGVVCAVLLKKVLGGRTPVAWAQPSDIQRGLFKVRPGDVVANLPLPGPVALWFDHHVSNAPDIPYEGLFRIAPSAARLVAEFFAEKIGSRFHELVRQADKIDAAHLTLEEIKHPECHPYLLLSMTLFSGRKTDQTYCDMLVHLLGTAGIDQVMADHAVQRRCRDAIEINRAYEGLLCQYTTVRSGVSITDFRRLVQVTEGNRFLVYALFPETCVNVKLYHEGPETILKLGHSILNQCCRVNVGKLLSRYNGGGHRGAGATRFENEHAEGPVQEIIDTLVRNEPFE